MKLTNESSVHTTVAKMRLGFLGVGWIGANRMEAVAGDPRIEITGIADPSKERVASALAHAPGATPCAGLDELMELPLDGVVIATPSALHPVQCVECLSRGLAVFCQKPLAPTGEQTRMVVSEARRAGRLLGIDMSYRYLEAVRRLRMELQSGAIGSVFAVDCVFHNAYGPDKPWFYDRKQSGGGCVVDLGIHLIDLALWLLDFPEVTSVSSRVFAGGRPLEGTTDATEDYAEVQMQLATGATVRMACSWNLAAGRDAVIGIDLYGTAGGLSMRNVEGSFYDFRSERYRSTRREELFAGPDQWGGRALRQWADQLITSKAFAEDACRVETVAGVIDAIYKAAGLEEGR